jgi:catechol 2,3-dioxygenase-like lactoylglutathione lyase family enzyme
MRNLIGQLSLFAAGIGVGIVLMQPGSAQENKMPAVRLNHVGLYAANYEESMRFYTQTMGFREAFTIRDAAGKPTLSYVQISKDTFIEIAPATAERPAGLSHVGIWPLDLNATVAALRQRGAKVGDPRTGATKTTITNTLDPNGIRLELLDFLPESAPRKAIDEWKP